MHYKGLVLGKMDYSRLMPYDENQNQVWVDETEDFKDLFFKDVMVIYRRSNGVFRMARPFDLIVPDDRYMDRKLAVGQLGWVYKGRLEEFRVYADEKPEVVNVLDVYHPLDYMTELVGMAALDYRIVSGEYPEPVKDGYRECEGLIYNPETSEMKFLVHRNPKGFYDWYKVGGRWEGIFTLENGEKDKGTFLKREMKEDQTNEEFFQECLEHHSSIKRLGTPPKDVELFKPYLAYSAWYVLDKDDTLHKKEDWLKENYPDHEITFNNFAPEELEWAKFVKSLIDRLDPSDEISVVDFHS